MKILFSGDSITLGQQGVSYVKKLLASMPDANASNIARNGETLNMISKRLLSHLDRKNDYDVIVLAGGLGDATFHLLKKDMGMMFRFAYFAQESIGMRPMPDATAFQNAYAELIRSVKERSNARIILATLNCSGELPSMPGNIRRNAFNEVIRQLAREENLMLADAGLGIDQYLRQNPGSSEFFLGSFWTLTYTDKLFALSGNGFDWLSKKRGLKVTFDGLHLNSKGAEIFASAMLETFRQNSLIAAV